ncbi:MAG: molybdopterin-binding protein, partial [Enterococcus sp.]
MKAEIIAVGTELLLGQVVNTNATFLSEKLADMGIEVYFHTVVGDNPARLEELLQLADQRSELIILCGGLGPTDDDLTKNVLADHVGVPLVQNEA